MDEIAAVRCRCGNVFGQRHFKKTQQGRSFTLFDETVIDAQPGVGEAFVVLNGGAARAVATRGVGQGRKAAVRFCIAA